MILQEKHIIPAIPAREVLREKSAQCDICKLEIKYRRPLDPEGSIEWRQDEYDTARTAIFLQFKSSGYGYDGGGDLNRTEYHVCPKCFMEKVEPFLQSLGAQPTKVEYDW